MTRSEKERVQEETIARISKLDEFCADRMVGNLGAEGMAVGEQHNLKFTLTPVCCVYESMTRLLHPKFCIACRKFWNENI